MTSKSKVSMALGQGSKKGAWRDGTSSAAGGAASATTGSAADGARSKTAAAAIPPSFVLTAASSRSGAGADAVLHAADTTTLPKRAAFRSSRERTEAKRNEYNTGGPRIARSNSKLLRADRKLSHSKLPNIRQLTSTSTDSEDDGGDDEGAPSSFDDGDIKGQGDHARLNTSGAVAASPPPARSSLSPMIRKASKRRVEYRARRLSGASSPTLTPDSTTTIATLDESQRRLIESEVGRHVESAVKQARSQIEAQEQRKQKAAAGIAALREMLGVLNVETSKLTSEVAEEEVRAAGSDLAAELGAQEEQAMADEELRRRQLQASEERVQMLRARLASAVKSKAIVTEATEDLEKQITVVKGKLEKERKSGLGQDLASDDLGQDLQAMQDLVEKQKEMRVALAKQLQALRGSRSTLQRELAAQTEELKVAEGEEQELRDRVSVMVSRLAGPKMPRAAEEGPYATMEAGIFVSGRTLE